MKRARRDRRLGQLHSALDSDDYDAREFAMFQLAMLLRRARGSLPSGDWSDQYPEGLSRDLLRIRLSQADQARAVARLARLLERYPESRATAFWALGEASAEVGLASALAAIQALGDQLSGEAAYQACKALRAWLTADSLDPKQARDALADHNCRAWLTRCSRSPDRRLAACANAVLRALQA